MAELTIAEGPGSGARITLSPDQAYTVGSDERDSIQIEGAGVGPKHLIIKALKSGGFGIKGLAGTFLHNGSEVQAARLTEGDRIGIGDCVLSYGPPEASLATPPASSSAAATPPAEPKPVGTRELGGFRLFEVLGKGGMGTVYRAEQISLSREVALKVLKSDLTADPVFVAKFVAEARAAARLHHPNVVQVFDVDNVDDTYFYSMELMHEGSVEQRLKAVGTLPVDESIQIIRDAARGLGFAESLRMVHRDIKPDNLMLDHHGNVKLADLGLAHTEEEQGGKLLGTPHFMSPEQIQRQPLDHRSDLYSLGCTFFRLVTGRTPFKGSKVKEIVRAHVKEEAPLAHKVDPAVPAEVGAIIARLLEKDPADRYQSADELIEALDSVEAPASRSSLLIVGIVAAVLVAVGAVVWASTRPEPEVPAGNNKEPEIVKVNDPAAAKQARESAAEAAYFKLVASGLEGDAKADALDAMAKEHPGTEYAAKAIAEAKALRQQVAQARAAAERRNAQLDQARSTLLASFDRELAAFSFAKAENLLALGDVPASLRDDSSLQAFVTELRARYDAAAKARLEALKAAVTDAAAQRDGALITERLKALQDLLAGPNAWPASAIAGRGDVERFISDTSITMRAIANEARATAEKQAWDSVRASIVGESGIARAIAAMDFDNAANMATTAASSIQGTDAAKRLADLAGALRAAAGFVTEFQAAARGGKLTITNGEPGQRLAIIDFAPTGANAGLKVRESRREKVIPIAQLRSRVDEVFSIPGREQDPARAALIGVLMISDQIVRVRTFLASLDAEGNRSDSAAYEMATDVVPDLLAHALVTCDEAWAEGFREEILAAGRVARAVRAFSMRRNTAAAELLENVIANLGHTLTVRALD